jgi:hypothetical protein
MLNLLNLVVLNGNGIAKSVLSALNVGFLTAISNVFLSMTSALLGILYQELALHVSMVLSFKMDNAP